MALQQRAITAMSAGSPVGIGLTIAQSLAGKGSCVIINGQTTQGFVAAIARLRVELCGCGYLQSCTDDLGDARGCACCSSQGGHRGQQPRNLRAQGLPRRRLGVALQNQCHERRQAVATNFPRKKADGMGRFIFVVLKSGLCRQADMRHCGMTKTEQLSYIREIATTTTGTTVAVNRALPGSTLAEDVEAIFTELAGEQGQSTAVRLAFCYPRAAHLGSLHRLIRSTSL